jgi:polyhydroxybutyrate depolymerase
MAKKILLSLSLLAGFVAVFGILCVFGFSRLNWTNGSIVSRGETRAYLLYVPATYDPAKPAPLVISLHGFAEWPAHQMQISHWNELAEEFGFLVVYPSGTGFPLRWNTYGPPGSETDPAREVQFISDLIDLLENEYRVDPNRVYANGLSNGGGMSFVLACRLADRIAAIGGVSGAYLLPWSECNPSRPVPAIIFHGTADPIVPYTGGESASFHYPFPDMPEWVAALADRNRCNDHPLDLPAAGEASGVRYEKCDQTADVIFYSIQGGGHAWPGGDPLPEFIVGHTPRYIDATRLMWTFFQDHPLKE